MTSASCREIRQSLGVYVLGAIDPAERAQVDDHLATCLECREELAGLAGLPALLRKVPVAEAERLAEPQPGGDSGADERLLNSLLARTASVRRARRWRGLAAAAAVVLVALGGGAAAMHAFQPAPAPVAGAHHWQMVAGTDPLSGAGLTVRYAPNPPWGTLMDIQVTGLRAGTLCQLQVTNAAGQRLTVGWWRLTYSGSQATWYRASTALGGKNLRSFEITSGGRLLAEVPVT